MDVRAFLIIPAAVVVAVLAGCGQTGAASGSGTGAGSGAAHLKAPSTWVCSAPDYIRERAPEGACDSVDGSVDGAGVDDEPVDDDLSPSTSE
jgi:hypothetical protein